MTRSSRRSVTPARPMGRDPFACPRCGSALPVTDERVRQDEDDPFTTVLEVRLGLCVECPIPVTLLTCPPPREEAWKP